MDIFQEPKYDIIDGKITNRATGIPIPDDEPIFIFRSQDADTVLALASYMGLCQNEHHREVVDSRIEAFITFQRDHPERVKVADSDASCLIEQGETP